jgi:hypothetical protein
MRRFAIGLGLVAITACGASKSGNSAAPTDGGATKPPPAGCATIYVSPAGSDSNTGCTQTAPRATIASAITYVKTNGFSGMEIHVCRGDFKEPNLILGYPVTLRGGYDCSTWARHDPFGWTGVSVTSAKANPFDATNESIIDAVDSPIALEVTSPAVTSAVAIDGFTIQGRASGGGTAVSIHDGAAPVLSNDVILGPAAGAVPNAWSGSLGVDLASTGAPEIMHCRIDGGGGQVEAGIGSAGIRVHTGTAKIHDNEIAGGHGSANQFSVIGISIDTDGTLTGDNALRNNSIFYGATNGVTKSVVAMGVSASTATDAVGNTIVGESIGCQGTGCISSAIGFSGAHGSATQNRVLAGTAGAGVPVLLGIEADSGSSDVLIANNVVDIGQGSVTGVAGIIAEGGARSTTIVQNTVFGHTDGGVSRALHLAGTNTIARANLATEMQTMLTLSECPTSNDHLPTVFQDNAAVDVDYLFSYEGTDCNATPGGYTRTSELEQRLATGPTNTRRFATDCAGESNCVACAKGQCAPLVFGRTPDASDLYAGSLQLRPSPPCLISQGVATIAAPLLDTDYAGQKRPNPSSIGAYENDVTCTQ